MKRTFWFAAGLGFATTFWFFRLPFSYGRKMSGYVIALFTRDNGDVVVKMNNDSHDFLISHGLDLDMDIEKVSASQIALTFDDTLDN